MTEPTIENNESGGQNRRYKLGYVFVALITIAYYTCIFRGLALDWWSEYAKHMIFWFGIIIGGLSLTDIAFHIKEAFRKSGGDAGTGSK